MSGGSGRIIRTVVVLVVVVTVGWAASSRHSVHDLTADKTLTLTPHTRSIIDRIDTDVTFTAFVAPDDPARVPAAALLDRYRKSNRRISWKVLDPNGSPGEANRLGVDPLTGGTAAQMGDRVVVVPSATESDLTAALARLLSDTDTVVCMTTGHGEQELGRVRALLHEDGHRVRDLDLLVTTGIPDECTVLFASGPAEPFGEAERVIGDWLAADGKVILLADPVAAVDHTGLLSPYGLDIVRGVVFEGDPESVIDGDVTAPIVRVYSSANPVVRNLAPTYFPGVQAIEIDDTATERTPGLTTSRLADTSPASYLETRPIEAVFDPAEDLPGPVTVAAAADVSRVDGESVRRSRLVVIGDVDFATDAFVDEAANASLVLRAVRWLAVGEDETAISPHLPTDRPLRLTDARVSYARMVTAGVVPALFLLSGALVWAIRRRR